MNKFALATLRQNSVPAIRVDGTFYPFSAELIAAYRDVKGALEKWDEAFPALCAYADSISSAAPWGLVGVPEADADLDMPIRYPNKCMAAGGNYASHLAEGKMPLRRIEPLPIYFMPPTVCMVGPGRTAEKPARTQKFDWEIELGIVIGKRLRNGTVAEGEEAIAGYTITLDMTARDMIKFESSPILDLVRSKAQDAMVPCGPVFVPKQFIARPDDLRLQTFVNGEKMQDGRTSEMMVPMPEIVSLISEVVTVEPGDVILTGTPAGCGASRGIYLNAGDEIRAEIEDIGTLVVQVYDQEIPEHYKVTDWFTPPPAPK